MLTRRELLQQHAECIALYEGFAALLSGLLSDWLQPRWTELGLFSVTGGAKDAGRAYRKMLRENGKYERVSDLPDLARVRVVTYFVDKVDKIVDVIKSRLIMSDREEGLGPGDPRVFGFGGRKLLVRLPEHLIRYPVPEQFKSCAAEIQVCTILQHVWAQMEHPHYEGHFGASWELGRGFYRMAGLLEVADHEFVRIRTLSEERIDAVDVRLKARPDSLPIDVVTLYKYYRSERAAASLDSEIAGMRAETVKGTVKGKAEIIADMHFMKMCASKLGIVGLQTIGEVQRQIEKNRVLILKMAKTMSPTSIQGGIMEGTCLLYLSYVTACLRGSLNDACELFRRIDVSSGDVQKRRVELFCGVYQEIHAKQKR